MGVEIDYRKDVARVLFRGYSESEGKEVVVTIYESPDYTKAESVLHIFDSTLYLG